jgi:hypothetical protein
VTKCQYIPIEFFGSWHGYINVKYQLAYCVAVTKPDMRRLSYVLLDRPPTTGKLERNWK